MQKWKAEEIEILKEIYKQGDLSLYMAMGTTQLSNGTIL